MARIYLRTLKLYLEAAGGDETVFLLEHEDVARAAPLFLLATFFWSFFSTVFLFDMLLVFFALVAVSGAVAAARGDGRGWIAVSLGIAFGILSKGPAILIPVLPVVLAAPAWSSGVRAGRWYPRAIAAVLTGLALSLAGALPAARSGGPAYGNAILLSQTAGRLTRSFAHARPVWWYVPFLPLLAFPWILWAAVWRRSDDGAPARDPGLRLCAIWAGAVFVVFSLVSGKQLYYLLSLMPPVALVAATRGMAGAGAALLLAERIGAEKRRTRGRARSALRHLTCRGCLSAVSAANEASSAAGHATEQRRAVGLQGRPPQ